jgi:uncharacterized protein (TIRG00374 family)
LIVSGIVLFVIAHIIPVNEVWSRIKLVSPALWVGIFTLFLLGHAFAAAKWRWMIGAGPSYVTALKAHFAGLAANIALPGVAGGDLVRAAMVMKGSTRKTSLAVGSLADRLIDSASLLVISAAGAFWLGAAAGANMLVLFVSVGVMLLFGIVGFVILRPVARLMRSRINAGKFAVLAGKLADAFEEMADRPHVLLGCAAMSIAIQTSFAVMNGVLASNLGAGTSIAMWVFAWPLAKLLATLPISFGGLGVREAGLAGLMAPLGIEAAGVVAASLCWQTILYAAGAVGALVQVLWRRQAVQSGGIYE